MPCVTHARCQADGRYLLPMGVERRWSEVDVGDDEEGERTNMKPGPFSALVTQNPGGSPHPSCVQGQAYRTGCFRP